MMVKKLFKKFGIPTNASIIIQTVYFTSEMSMRLSNSVSTIFSLFVRFSTIFTLIPSWRFLIVRVVNFLQAFEENFLFAVYKTALIES